MIQTDYSPDKFGTYLSHPDCKVFIVRNTGELWRESGTCSFFYSPYTSSVSNYDRYLHSLLREIGEEFNDTVITEVKGRWSCKPK